MDLNKQVRLQEVPVCQGHTLKSHDTVRHAADHGATKVVTEYRSMMEDRMDLTPLE